MIRFKVISVCHGLYVVLSGLRYARTTFLHDLTLIICITYHINLCMYLYCPKEKNISVSMCSFCVHRMMRNKVGELQFCPDCVYIPDGKLEANKRQNIFTASTMMMSTKVK
jgi:hypothetical protein